MVKLKYHARHFASQVFPHDNPRCVAPPGKISSAEGKPVIICSFMRTGTHLLIDLILNHFPSYRRSPLYINLDSYANQSSNTLKQLSGCGNYIIKTHYPEYPSAHKIVHSLAENSFIIRTDRNEVDNYRSLQNFAYPYAFSEFQKRKEAWELFWESYTPSIISFTELTSRREYQTTVTKVAEILQQPMPPKIIYPPQPHNLSRALWDKLRTRVLGKHSPRINTTIQFATTKKAANK